ncbi:MAG: DNA topoisomerase, partial [Clostridia bacterium]|nr:DNA topoisomerase [Clostridia bacterium]
YSVITAEGQGVRWEWQGKDGNRLFDADKTARLLNKLRGQDGRVTDLKQKTRRINPPLLYDLTTLQRDANARIGMSAKDTLRHLQRLYEVHKLVTYPRTDSRYLTDDLAATMPDRLAALKSSAYGDTVRRINQGQAKLPAAFYNPAKVSDHHALLPTEIRPGSAQLNHDEQFIYSLIVERFLGAFLGPAEVRDTSLEADIAGERFTARGEVTVKAGWRSVAQDESALEETDDDTDTAQTLPDLQVGSPLKNLSFKNNERRTRAPHRFSEGTLLAAMENPQAFVDDARANKILKESGGIGTPATRADIIEKLFRNFYITKDGKSLVPTAKGRQVIDLVPEPLRSPLLTAQWEERLAAIAKGQDDAAAFDADMRRFAGDLVRAVKNSDAIFKHDNETNLPCPHCGKLLLAVDGKRGKMRVCPDPTCGYRETVSQTTGARCPQCRHQLVIIHKDDKKLYACNHCGFREPFDRFNDKHKGGKKSSRRDVAAYQKKQAKEKDIGANAFADAWAAALKNKKDQ